MKIIICPVFLLLLHFPLECAYEDIGMGARPASLADAYTALADDVNGIYYNPAGLGQLEQNELSINFSKLFWNLENDDLYRASLGMSIYGINWGTLGIAWKMFYSDLYQENEIFFAYAQDFLTTLLKLNRSRLYSGVTLKLLQKNYKYNGYVEMDPVFDKGTSRLGVTGDLGILYKMRMGLSVGLSCANVTSPDMGLQEKSIVPFVLRAGLAYLLDHLLYENSSDKWLNDFHVLVDEVYRDGQHRISGGIEFYLFHTISLRGAYAYGTDKLSRVASGIGFRKTYTYPSEIRKAAVDSESYSIVETTKSLDIAIHYSFSFYLNGAEQDTLGNHYIEVGIKY